MSEWSLPILLENLHDDVEHRLSTVRKSFAIQEQKVMVVRMYGLNFSIDIYQRGINLPRGTL